MTCSAHRATCTGRPSAVTLDEDDRPRVVCPSHDGPPGTLWRYGPEAAAGDLPADLLRSWLAVERKFQAALRKQIARLEERLRRSEERGREVEAALTGQGRLL